jgi:hypothetical protein
MKSGLTLFLAALVCVSGVAAQAHEPLWGESPQTFAFGVWHPEIRLAYENADQFLAGSRLIPNPMALRRTRFDALFSLQYAPRTSLNVRLDIPYASVTNWQTIQGRRRSTIASGLGNLMLSAKSRLLERFGEDWKIHHAVSLGLQLPTGENSGRLPDGTLLGPSFQPGSGKFGLMLGYAFAYERLQDTTWASVMYQYDFGGTGRRGDLLMVDAAYGYWLRRAKRPQEFGFLVAAGLHFEVMGKDHLAFGPDPNSGYTTLGIQVSLIATWKQSQFRVGALVPITQNVNGQQLRPELQMRAGWEMLF